ncbi:MAG: HD domain-containing protein [Nanoarchaeota archaeon]
MDVIGEVRNFVKSECEKPSSKYGMEPFEHYFKSIVKYSKDLAKQKNADKEVVTIAAWLHDIGSIMYGRENHHETGCEVAEKLLLKLNYPKSKIERVKLCIFNHRGSNNFERESIEEQIVAEADVMSNFDNLAGIFKAAYVYEKLSQSEAKKSIREKLTRKWNQLHFEESRKFIKPKYEAAMLLLK